MLPPHSKAHANHMCCLVHCKLRHPDAANLAEGSQGRHQSHFSDPCNRLQSSKASRSAIASTRKSLTALAQGPYIVTPAEFQEDRHFLCGQGLKTQAYVHLRKPFCWNARWLIYTATSTSSAADAKASSHQGGSAYSEGQRCQNREILSSEASVSPPRQCLASL